MNPAEGRFRYAVGFRVEGDVRFLAHSDMMRLFSRAMARAELPISFSEGFNPHARLSLPFPRPVGQASDVELAIVDLARNIPADQVFEQLARQMPTGIVLSDVTQLETAKNNLYPVWVRYCIELPSADCSKARESAPLLLDASTFEFKRVRHKDRKTRTIDLRPYIDAIQVDEQSLMVSMHVTNAGSVTPAEVCSALGIEAEPINHLVRRVEISWQNEPIQNPPS